MHRHRHVTAGALQVLAWNEGFQAMYAKDQLGQNRNRGSKVDTCSCKSSEMEQRCA